jgi:hypothetical protein
MMLGFNVDSENSPVLNVAGAYKRYYAGPESGIGKVSGITFYDVTGIKLKPLDISKMQYTATQNLEVLIAKPTPWLDLAAIGGAGLQGTQDTAVTPTYNGGINLDFDLGKKAHLWVMPQALKTNATGTAFQLRVMAGIYF